MGSRFRSNDFKNCELLEWINFQFEMVTYIESNMSWELFSFRDGVMPLRCHIFQVIFIQVNEMHFTFKNHFKRAGFASVNLHQIVK